MNAHAIMVRPGFLGFNRSRLGLLIFVILIVTGRNALGTDYYISTGGHDGNDGTSLASPFATLQKAINQAVAGDTIHVRGGTYREEVMASTGGGAPGAYLTITAHENEVPVFMGSDIVTGWQLHQGAIWKKTGWTIDSQQVFCNERYLQQIGIPGMYYDLNSYTPVGTGLADMVPGTFYYDATARTLYVWLLDDGDPNATKMEASTKRWILSLHSIPFVHVKGLAIRHCNSSRGAPQGFAVSLGPDSIIEDCDIQWCDYEGLELKSRSQALHCIISNNGDVGVGASRSQNILVRRCVISGNNYRKFNTMWHAGGLKLVPDASGTVEECDISSNNGNGVWFDWCRTGNPIIIRNNRLRDNARKAIFVEGSNNALVYNNLVVDNREVGISITASNGTRCYNNTIVGAGWHAAISLAGVPRADCTLKNNLVFNNIMFGGTGLYDLQIPMDNGGDTEGNISDFNCFFRANGSLKLGSSGQTYLSLETWRAATGFDSHSISEKPRFNLATADDYSTSPTSGTVNAGVVLAEVPDDIRGVSRPQGAAPDMGAFETGFLDCSPPTANAGPDLKVVDDDGNGFEQVLLDAGASLAGDAPLTSFVWRQDGVTLASGMMSSPSLPTGEHTIQLVVTDSIGLEATDEIVVTISRGGLVNGSFESGYEGWAASGNQDILSSAPYAATDGMKLVAFNGINRVPNGVLSQTFATTAGQTYLLSFDIGVLAYNTNELRLQANVDGNIALVSRIFKISGGGDGTTRWATHSLPFTADSASSTLTFRDISLVTNSIDLLLDNVRIVPQIVRTLTVESSPNAGVSVTVGPGDESGLANGNTNFRRNYMLSTVVGLTAPPTAAGYRFQKWLKDGADIGTDFATSVTMDDDHTLTAVYVESAPIVTEQPVDLTASRGGGVTFRVTAEGSGSLAYQWRFNGFDIAGADKDTFTIDNVQDEHAGTYDVVITNAAGTATSNPAVLTVITTILANGSFEAGYPGWSASGNQEIQSSSPYAATDGLRLVVFNSSNRTPNAMLSQSFATVTGRNYTLSFDAGVLSYNNKSQTMDVTVTGGGNLLSRTITIYGQGGGTNRWLPQTFAFVADSMTATLVFCDRSSLTDSQDLLLDNVRITETPPPPNTSPVAVSDSYATPLNTALIVQAAGILSNDTDAESNPLRAVIDAGPVHGDITLNADGGFVYIPTNGYSGIDAFSYHANDGSLNSNVVTVNITVHASASGQLVNGSFEAGYQGWNASGNLSIQSSAPYAATDGSKLISFNDVNLTPNAAISQSFATIAGQTYSLKFDAGVLSYNTLSQKMEVTVTGTGSLLSRDITILGAGGGTNRWLSHDFTFVADSASASLMFRDRSSYTKGLDLLLDNVTVAETGGAIVVHPPPQDDTPPIVPTISGVPGALKIGIPGANAGLYELQRSKDLKAWVAFARIQLQEPGPLEFLDTSPPEDRMFYRIARHGTEPD